MAEGGEILEGFLCPICKADLRTALLLHSHFQEAHNDDQDQDVLKSLRGFLGKAKKKILKLDEDLFSTEVVPSRQLYNVQSLLFDDEPQELGASRSHFNQFRTIRNGRAERCAIETNKLIIRLDKLLTNLPNDPLKRKAHERNVVPWAENQAVPLCPGCAKKFHLARRRHHCRACGAVLCQDCSVFLPIVGARKMVEPGPVTVSTSLIPPSQLHRSNSQTSVNSLADSETGEPHFRLCLYCCELLESRERMKEERGSKPIVSQFYERLKTYEREAEELAATYWQMWESLGSGETKYSLQDAQTLRVKLLKLAESMDSLSKRILVLGTKDVTAPTDTALRLQKQVRAAATLFLRERLATLPNLPSEAQLKELGDRRKEEAQARIEQERQALPRAPQRASPQRATPQRNAVARALAASNDQVVADTGWGPEVAQMYDSDDPMIQQMNIIRNYIRQARTAHKYDEVSLLETNLRELQAEYYRQQEDQSNSLESSAQLRS